MTIDWTLIAPVVAVIAGTRIIMRSWRQHDAGEIERRVYLATIGGALGAFWGSLYFGVGHPWMAGFLIALTLPELVIPERLYPRFEAWFMRHFVTKKQRMRWEAYVEKQANDRAAEIEFQQRMEQRPELTPGPPQGNDP